MSELTNDFSLPKTANGRIGLLNNASGHQPSESLDHDAL